MDPLGIQVAAAIATTYAIQWLKGKLDKTSFPLGFSNPKFNAFVAGVFAFATSLGIAFHFDAAAHQLIISGLSWEGVQTGAGHFVQQYLFQHAAYKSLVAPSLPGFVQAQKRDAAAAADAVTQELTPLKPPTV
jgi:hypothetical protein